MTRLRRWWRDRMGLDEPCWARLDDTARWCLACASLLVPPEVLNDWREIP